jgi:hypothetical protein
LEDPDADLERNPKTGPDAVSNCYPEQPIAKKALTHTTASNSGPEREPADAKARQFKIRTSTLDALDACVPSGQKSAFVSEAIDVAIRRRYVKR